MQFFNAGRASGSDVHGYVFRRAVTRRFLTHRNAHVRYRTYRCAILWFLRGDTGGAAMANARVQNGPGLRRLVRRSMRALSAVIIVTALISPASAAGFFEALFGARQVQRPIYPAPGQQLMLPPLNGANRLLLPNEIYKPRIVKVSPAGPIVRTPVRPAVLSGPLGPFLMDPTLRRGDVVVTTEGLKVFTGSSNIRHSQADFAALARASQFAAGNSTVLAAIERANRFSAKPLVEVRAAPPAPARQAALPASPPRE